MEVITISSDAFQQILTKIDGLGDKLEKTVKTQPLTDNWLDIQEVCWLLKISKRTLQYYRDNKVLPYSQIGGKIYFKAADIDEHLQTHYNKSLKK